MLLRAIFGGIAKLKISGASATEKRTMHKTNPRVWRCIAVGLMLSALTTSIEAQQAQGGPVWCYALVEGSQLVDDCPICDRVPIVRPLRGTFQLRLLQQGPLFSTYALENISLTAGDTNGPNYKVLGKGTYRIGGEIASQQYLFLEVSIDNGVTNLMCLFTNAVPGVSRRWPMIQVGVDQTNGTVTQQYHLDLATAPLREIWFSTTQAFKAGLWNPPTNLVSAGDFISSIGRVVKRNQELTRNLGIMPPVPDLGLKDVDILPGGEIAFSIQTPAFSESQHVTAPRRSALGPGPTATHQSTVDRAFRSPAARDRCRVERLAGHGGRGDLLFRPD